MNNKDTYQLNDLLEGLEMVSTDATVYFNKKTKEFTVITDDQMRTYETYCDGDNDLLEWEKDMVKIIDVIMNDTLNQYIQLPSSYHIHEHQVMVDFAYTLNDPINRIFLEVLYKKGAFRNFQQKLLDYGLRKKWFSFKRDAYIEILKTWCEENKITYEL
ncbi:MAG: UPF0158 family protein [Acholeplasmataceae bacterium]|jgi:hypothetical protein|nr:UPF0158 family protein [Acholeplasmataceae bacterium]